MPSATAPFVLATLHPAAVLRMPSSADRERALQQMILDLTPVPDLLKSASQVFPHPDRPQALY